MCTPTSDEVVEQTVSIQKSGVSSVAAPARQTYSIAPLGGVYPQAASHSPPESLSPAMRDLEGEIFDLAVMAGIAVTLVEGMFFNLSGGGTAEGISARDREQVTFCLSHA